MYSPILMVHQAYEYNENQVYDYNDLKQFSVDDFDDEEVSKKREQALLSMKREETHDSKSSLDNDNDKFGQHKSSTQGEQLPSNLSDESSSSAIKRLHEIKNSISGLRGGSQDAVAFMSEANEIVKSKFTKLHAFLNEEENEDVDPKAILGDIVSESNALSRLQNEKGGGGHGHGLDLSTLNGMDVDIPLKQVSNMFNMIQEKININFKALAESTTALLERALVEMPILDKTSRKGRRLDEDQGQDQEPDEPFASFNFGPRDRPRFNPRTGTNQQIRTMMRDAYAEGRMRVHRRNKHKKHMSNNHRRRHLEESGTCPMPCDMNDILCNCQKLYDCASEISPYDLSVMFLHG